MNEKELIKKSRFLSLILRHEPEKVGLKLDDKGWANVEELLKKANYSLDLLEEIVATNNKKRFEFNENKTKIRACQGHSIDVDLDLKEVAPPTFLFHGTQTDFITSIHKNGLSKMKRNHVHLSADRETAEKVAIRRGEKFAILTIASEQMHIDGHKFYQSTNGVWLTDNVPTKYIHLIEFKNNINLKGE